MYKTILLTIIVLLSNNADAKPKYVNLTHESTEFYINDTNKNLFKFLIKEKREISFIVSAVKIDKTKKTETSILPPTPLKRLTYDGKNFTSVQSFNNDIIESEFINDNEKIVVTFNYISTTTPQMNNLITTLSKLTESLIPIKNIANSNIPYSELYENILSLALTPLTSPSDIKSTFTYDINTEFSEKELPFYITKESRNTQDYRKSIATTKLFIKEKSPSDIDFKEPIKRLGILRFDEEKILDKMISSIDHREKLKQCQELKGLLQSRFSQSKVKDILALSIDESNWPQDLTAHPCIDKYESLNYNKVNQLKNITFCSDDICIRSIESASLIQNGGPLEVIKRITNNNNFEDANICAKNLKDAKLYINKETIKQEFKSDHMNSFSFDSCLSFENRREKYKSTIFWEKDERGNNRVFNFYCDLVPNQPCDNSYLDKKINL
ncbi:hypothetical protein [Rheinheimera sp. MM224]|uniref:hypothetical protein n=1 Tax=Rheinheimera sp. MM224 TaxID=3019969 RepID=UPI0021F8B280|nr:hypothetical protein [Rheinheimera sp. MM224]CAI3804189.1 hypothetical protein JAMGFMIE_03556 [Rheinheimera sp. MM224]